MKQQPILVAENKFTLKFAAIGVYFTMKLITLKNT